MSVKPPADLEVALRGGYYFGEIERLIADLQPLFAVTDPVAVEVDLSGLVFIGPTATALLLATANRLAAIGCSVFIAPPRNRLTRNYLLRSDFVRLFTATDPPEPFGRLTPAGFRPCLRFDGDAECIAVARELSDAVIERARTDIAARGAIKTAMHELAENVMYHADSLDGGYAAVAYSRRRREIEIGIVDLGIGIRASLNKNPDYAVADDVAAVEKAMIPTVTSTPERNSGYGLTFTKLLLLLNGGSMRIRSGHGAATLGPAVDYSAKEHPFPGTLVHMRARTDRPLDATSAWDELAKAIKNVVSNANTDAS